MSDVIEDLKLVKLGSHKQSKQYWEWIWWNKKYGYEWWQGIWWKNVISKNDEETWTDVD